MDSNQKRFIDDTLDLLNELDDGLMQLETNPVASAPLEQVFRSMHTIKGAANMFGFENIGELAHHLETLFDLVRQGRLQVSDDLISITLHAFDKVRDLLRKKDIRKVTSTEALQDHIEAAMQFLKDVEASSSIMSGTIHPQDVLTTFLVRATPTIRITTEGNHPLLYIIKDLASLGTTKTFLHREEDQCIAQWDLFLATTTPPAEIESYFIFNEHECRTEIIPLGAGDLLDSSAFLEAVDLHQKKEITLEELKTTMKALSDKHPSAAGAGVQKLGKEEEYTAPPKTVLTDTVIKVSKRKIDDLLNWISELITLQAQLANVAQQNRIVALSEVTERMEALTNHLRDTSLEIGLVPIETLVTKFKRLVRDLSKSLGKKVNFVSKGAETEIDKDVIEMMAEPILHLIRNAIDHGIETPALREQLGKSEYGTIRLKAFRSNSSINFVVSDDGKGIDKEKVLQKAVEKGLATMDREWAEEDILKLIFHPGLSTVQAVSDVSGRGVGMDVVNQRISELRGTVTISSAVNEGTSFHIKLPLSRSIIDGLLVKVAGTRYVVPLAMVEHIDRIPYADLNREQRVYTDVIVNNEPIPVFCLRKRFHDEKTPPRTADIISVTINGVRKGLAVDSIEGKMQAVLKPLGDLCQHVDFISGSTILGDGTMALVLDPHRLFTMDQE
jgi:two-component system, chemotaxis family, sensor kinase CheA